MCSALQCKCNHYHWDAVHTVTQPLCSSSAASRQRQRRARAVRHHHQPHALVMQMTSITSMRRGRGRVVCACVRVRSAVLDERMTQVQCSAAPLSQSDSLAVLSLSARPASRLPHAHPKAGRLMSTTPTLSGLGAAPTAARQLGVFEPLNDTARLLPHGQTRRHTDERSDTPLCSTPLLSERVTCGDLRACTGTVLPHQCSG